MSALSPRIPAMVTLQDGGIIKVLTSVNSTQDAKERETTFILRMPVADNVYRNTVSVPFSFLV